MKGRLHETKVAWTLTRLMTVRFRPICSYIADTVFAAIGAICRIAVLLGADNKS